MTKEQLQELRQGLYEIAVTSARLLNVLDEDEANVGKLLLVDFRNKKLLRTLGDKDPVPEFTAADVVTVGKCFDYWYETYVKARLKESTRRSYELYIAEYLKPGLGSLRLHDVSGDDLQRFLMGIEQPNTRKKLAYMLRPAFKKAVVLGKIDRNPFDAVELPGYEYEHYRPLEFFEQNAVLEAIAGNRLQTAVFWVISCTGLRIGEFLALDFAADVDYTNNFISVTKGLDIHTGKIISSPKTKKGKRKVPFLPALVPHLQYLRDCGRKLSYNVVRCYFWRIYRRCGFKRLNLHSLRHTFISLAYYAGIKEKYIQVMVGHSKIDTTLDIYTHLLKPGTSPILDYVRELSKLFE